MTFRLRAILATALLLVFASCDPPASSPPTVDFENSEATETPKISLTGRVTDAARILDPAQEATLTEKLADLELRTRHQMVIATVPTLGGQDEATFTRNLGNRWGIGRKGYDDGVVLLVAPNERKVRIAVGYGLEKILTDAVCQNIIDRLMLPRFSDGDLPGGIEAGTNELIARLSKNALSNRN